MNVNVKCLKEYETLPQIVSKRESLEKLEPVLVSYQKYQEQLITLRKTELKRQKSMSDVQKMYLNGKTKFYEHQYGIIAGTQPNNIRNGGFGSTNK